MKGELKKKERKEFEEEDRIKWIESKEEILNKFINELELEIKKRSESAASEEIDDFTEVPAGKEESLSPAPVSRTATTLNDILPPKPENPLLSLPKSKSKEGKSPESPDTLVFSEEIQSKHDNLTNELIATVQLIKRNNLHIQKTVKSDEKVISEATGLLATNSESMQKESKNLKSYSKKAWVSFWKMIIILLFICLAFIFIYIFIRLT